MFDYQVAPVVAIEEIVLSWIEEAQQYGIKEVASGVYIIKADGTDDWCTDADGGFHFISGLYIRKHGEVYQNLTKWDMIDILNDEAVDEYNA